MRRDAWRHVPSHGRRAASGDPSAAAMAPWPRAAPAWLDRRDVLSSDRLPHAAGAASPAIARPSSSAGKLGAVRMAGQTPGRRTPGTPASRPSCLDQRRRQALAFDAVVEAPEHARGVLEDCPGLAQVRRGAAGCARRAHRAPRRRCGTGSRRRRPRSRTRAPSFLPRNSAFGLARLGRALQQAGVAEQDVGVCRRQCSRLALRMGIRTACMATTGSGPARRASASRAHRGARLMPRQAPGGCGHAR